MAPTRPHAVSSVTGTLNATYAYDANGNLTSGGGRDVAWTAFDMPSTISMGTTSVAFAYDADHARVTKTTSAGTLSYLTGAGARSERLEAAGFR